MSKNNKAPTGAAWHCKHPDCKWKATPGSANGCDYTYLTGHDRRAGLPKEKWAPCYCDKYDPGEKVRRPRRNIVIEPRKANTHKEKEPRKEEQYASALDILKQAHREGLSDTKISERLGWPKGRTVYWRKKLGLASNIPQCGTKYDLKLCEKLYKEGRKDAEIANAMGCHRDIVRHWRDRRGLPPNP